MLLDRKPKLGAPVEHSLTVNAWRRSTEVHVVVDRADVVGATFRGGAAVSAVSPVLCAHTAAISAANLEPRVGSSGDAVDTILAHWVCVRRIGTETGADRG